MGVCEVKGVDNVIVSVAHDAGAIVHGDHCGGDRGNAHLDVRAVDFGNDGS